jgi:nucleotide-binding universal stress UspA family protein
MKILVAMDGSESALKAMRTAANLFQGAGARLTLAYVMSKPLAYPADFPGWGLEAFEEEERKWAKQMLSDAARQASDFKVAVDTVVLGGSPSEAIADEASLQGYDMVAVGSRGRGAVTRVLLGSVADRLAHICKTPVLVVH